MILMRAMSITMGHWKGWALKSRLFGTLKWQERSECHLGLVVYNVTLHTLPPPPIQTGLCTEQLKNQQRHIKYIILYMPPVHKNLYAHFLCRAFI
jgi:hypothetical protein